MADDLPPAPTGETLELHAGRQCHPETQQEHKHCGSCQKDCYKVGVTSLVYTFEVCSCPSASYEHVAEQLWHRACFLRSGGVLSRPAPDGPPRPR